MVRGDDFLVMKRHKFGLEYYTLIGGGVELGEELEEALRREVREETGMSIENPRLVFVEEAGVPYGTQYVYACDYVNGEPVLQPDAAEAAISKLGQNIYQPMWVKFADLDALPFRSERLKQAIQTALAAGYPAEPWMIVG